MDSGMNRWYRAAEKRFSVRKYSLAPALEDMLALESAAAELSVRSARIAVGVDQEAFGGLLGSKIKGTSAFAAFISSGADAQTVGYLGEAFILECAAMGIDTCWLGANFNRRAVSRAIGLTPGEKLWAVTPLGKGAEQFVRRKRKSIQELTWLSDEEFGELALWQQRAIECARIAPSAINAQPYEILSEADGIMLVSDSKNFGFSGIDMGIAMLHIELGAASALISGEWRSRGNGRLFTPAP